MNNTLLFGIHAIEANTVFSAITFQCIDLGARYRIGYLGSTVGWDIMIGGCKSEFGMAYGAFTQLQAFECLRTGYFMNEVPINVEQYFTTG